MATQTTVPQSKGLPALWRWVILGVAIVVFWIVLPPFRIVSLDSDGKPILGGEEAAAAFDATQFVEQFWSDKLVPSFATAADLSVVLPDVRRDPAEAMKRHGRKVGVGTTVYYFARGEGSVVEVKGSRILVDVDGLQVALKVGPVFGNTVRDGCGLLSVNDVPGLEEFNELSAALNHKVETEVTPAARENAKVGSRISFVGCAPAPESGSGVPVLSIVPLQVEVLP